MFDRVRPILALFVIALFLTQPVQPAVAGPAPPPDGSTHQTSLAETEADSNASALDLRRAAITAAKSIEPRWGFQRRSRARILDRLNATIPAYRDEHRLASAGPLRDDRLTVLLLRWMGSDDGERAAELVVASNRLAIDTSIADARRALRRAEAREIRPRTYRRAERSISRAVRAHDRALNALERDGWWRQPSRIRALVHLRLAWRHSNRALDVLDRALSPTVTIHTRADPPWNVSATANRTIRGTVWAVRPPGAVTVAVDGETVEQIALGGAAPALNSTFVAAIELERPVARIVATVADDTGKARTGPPPWRDRLRDRWESRRHFGWVPVKDPHPRDGAVAVVKFDGDGLPDSYEEDRLGTDPLDPDSDAAVTAVDESDDDLADGGEDFDGDRLITYAEYELGTDAFVADSDGDGLPDRFEASQPGLLDPTRSDTDNDGVADGIADIDGDGLAATAEYANGTSLVSADSDHDGLTDGVEIRRYGTAPLDSDTDDDSLGDAEEIRLGTNPRRADTDGDGIGDGAETYTTRIDDKETGLEITVEGRGDVASGIEVTAVGQPNETAHLPGPVVRIVNRSAFERATVTFSLDGLGHTRDPTNQSIYTWHPGKDRPWHRLNTSVDTGNRTVSATVPDFSYFAVLDPSGWETVITDIVALPWPGRESFDGLDGWTVDGSASIKGGNLVVTGGTGQEADIVVTQDGTGDFEAIGPAIEASGDGDTILVRRGTYVESIELTTSVQLRGRDVTLDGVDLADASAGVRLAAGTSASLSGLDIRGFDTAIRAEAGVGRTVLRNVTIKRGGAGVVAPGTLGDWALRDVRIVGTGGTGLSAWGSEGDWRLANVTIAGNDRDGIDAYGSSGDWSLENVEIVENGGVGVALSSSVGDWSLSALTSGRNEDEGVDAWNASGDVSADWLRLRGNGDTGVGAGQSTGDWEIGGGEIGGNDGPGIGAYGSDGDWTLHSIWVGGNHGDGIEAGASSGRWELRSVKLVRNEDHGIDRYGAAGDWAVRASTVTDNGDDGISAISGTGQGTVIGSTLTGNDGADLSVSGAEHPPNAAWNWWGQPAGPTPGQLEGPATVLPVCGSPSCDEVNPTVAAVGMGFQEPNRGSLSSVSPGGTAGDRTESTVVRRQASLPAGAAAITVRAKVRSTDSAGSAVAVAGPGTTIVLESAADDPTSFGIRTADLTRFAGEIVTVEVSAGDADRVEVDWIDVAVDTDGDGLRDAVEGADFGLPVGPRPGASLASLDPTVPDTDGDGLLDGEELEVKLVGLDDEAEEVTIRPVAAVSDPTKRNSDGGGLTDGEELAAGSDPFVFEKLAVGYTVPTMTEGPEDTLEDRNPMTVEEVGGLLNDGGPDSSIVLQPAHQFFNPLFCIKELTAGPGCSDAWMRGIRPKDDVLYLYVPFLVYANSDVNIGEVPYQITPGDHYSATVVKSVNESGTVRPGRSSTGYFVYSIAELRAAEEAQTRAFRSLGKLDVEFDLSSTVFHRNRSAEGGRPFTVSTNTLLPATVEMLEDAQFVLEKGMTISSATEAGVVIAARTGSIQDGAFVFMYEVVKGELNTPPTNREDLAVSSTLEGLGTLQRLVELTERDIEHEIFGDGVVRPSGPIILRQN